MVCSQDSNKILVVTSTYHRANRASFFRRCHNTFSKIQDLHWLLVEDAEHKDPEIELMLQRSTISYTYLNLYSGNNGNQQKNLALTYIRDHGLKGKVYIADDDNRYDDRLFEEIRKTKKISIFPVGNLGSDGIEKPVIQNGMIVGWDADWLSRKFPVDQAGFAFDAELLANLEDPIWSHSGYGGETEFIEKLVDSADELEVLCDNGNQCYVWHNDLKPAVWFLGASSGPSWAKAKNLIRQYLGFNLRKF